MSNRIASSPPVVRWPFVLGDALFLGLALIVLFTGERPPSIGAFVIAALCIGAGALLLIAPFVRENEARLRLAEAAVRDSLEGQLRRLTQTTEQLAHAVSRSQSTEEQAGQALGTLEELTEKLTTQAEELAQGLARGHERELAALKHELERVTRERDEQLAALAERVAALAGTAKEAQSAVRQGLAANTRSIAELREALASRPEPARAPAPAAASGHDGEARAVDGPPPPPAREVSPPSRPHHESTPAVDHAGTEKPATAAKVRARRAAEPDGVPPPRERDAETPLELPLEPAAAAPRPRAGADPVSLVATAYIGIGNKLFVRGEGPGLSWDRGVPMQFLAIGKWGWTVPESDQGATCRIYRNDDTPMLDENIVIAPGGRVEITPRF